jgi:hypothetical protein
MSSFFSRRQNATRAMVVFVGLPVVSCTTVPTLQPTGKNSIPIRDIVDRIYCELDYALKDRMAKDPKKDAVSKLLRDWTAKIDLTFTINTSSGISPGVSFIDPLPQVVDKATGTFSQSFTFGLGAGLSGSVNRVEKLSLEVELKDLKHKIFKGKASENEKPCNPGEWVKALEHESGEALTRDLGFKEWIDSTLDDLSDEIKIPSAEVSTRLTSFEDDADRRLRGLRADLKSLLTAQPNGQTAALQAALGAVDRLRSKVRHLSLIKTGMQHDEANDTLLREVDSAITGVDDSIKGAIPDDILATKNDLISWIQDQLTQIRQSLVASARTKNPDEHHPMLTLKTITHQVIFIVAFNASATPSWSLMRFKGPGGGSSPSGAGGSSSAGGSTGSSGATGSPGSLAYALRSDSHDLLITLGSKNVATGGNVGIQNQIDQLSASFQRPR